MGKAVNVKPYENIHTHGAVSVLKNHIRRKKEARKKGRKEGSKEEKIPSTTSPEG